MPTDAPEQPRLVWLHLMHQPMTQQNTITRIPRYLVSMAKRLRRLEAERDRMRFMVLNARIDRMIPQKNSSKRKNQ